MCWWASGEVRSISLVVKLAGGAELIEDTADVDGVPGDDGVDDDRETERVFGLLVGGALADVAFVGVEDGGTSSAPAPSAASPRRSAVRRPHAAAARGPARAPRR